MKKHLKKWKNIIIKNRTKDLPNQKKLMYKKEGTRRKYPFFNNLVYSLNKPDYLLTDSLISHNIS